MRIVLERRRAEQQHVAAEIGNGRDGAPCRIAWMPWRPPQVLRLVDDEQIDTVFDGLLGQLRALD